MGNEYDDYGYKSFGQGWGTVPRFSQGQRGSLSDLVQVDPAATSPLLTGTASLGDWTKGFGAKTTSMDLLPQVNDMSWSGQAKGALRDWFGTTKEPGIANLAVGGAQSLFGAWLGMQQYKLAKEKLTESKRQFELNYDASKRTTNAQLEGRQRALVASNPGLYESVTDYMNKYGIK